MTQEEKAKRYEQALERARQFSEHPLMEDSSNVVEYVFPELRESGDEKIRKEIVDFITSSNKYGTNERCEAWLNWLEKQGSEENKGNLGGISSNSAWSEADEDLLTSIEYSLSDYLDYTRKDGTLTHSQGIVKLRVVGYIDWIKSLKQRIGG